MARRKVESERLASATTGTRSLERREERRVRRGRQPGRFAGQGNGTHTYSPVRATNKLGTKDDAGRRTRQLVLAARDHRDEEYVAGIRKRLVKNAAAKRARL
jgi:hypothetical protein